MEGEIMEKDIEIPLTAETKAFVTEYDYFKIDAYGMPYDLVLKAWRVSKRKDEYDKDLYGLRFNIVSMNNLACKKEWTSYNKQLNRLLYSAIAFAEDRGEDSINVRVTRLSRTSWECVDMRMVRLAAGVKV